MTQSRLSVVLPAKNEAGAIEKVIRSIQANISDCEILVVDDGSTDNTAELAEKAGARHESQR